MQWQGRRESTNVEDRRGMSGPMRIGGGLGLGGVLLVLALSFFTGQDPADLVQGLDPGGGASQPGPPATDESSRFMRVVLADTEETWDAIFRDMGQRYEPPKLVLFEGATPSACGLGQSAMGPFYCPRDRDVYLDLSFFSELASRFGAPGEFAQAYVVAHEVGHHVQTLTGLSDRVDAARRGASQSEANALSVRQELQADCYAGVWGHYAGKKGMVDMADVENGLRAAAAIGDDRLQKQTQGRVVPESFTHGSSAQRVEWFRRGLQAGRVDACNTF
jgi:predicted metalloprotease